MRDGWKEWEIMEVKGVIAGRKEGRRKGLFHTCPACLFVRLHQSICVIDFNVHLTMST